MEGNNPPSYTDWRLQILKENMAKDELKRNMELTKKRNQFLKNKKEWEDSVLERNKEKKRNIEHIQAQLLQNKQEGNLINQRKKEQWKKTMLERKKRNMQRQFEKDKYEFDLFRQEKEMKDLQDFFADPRELNEYEKWSSSQQQQPINLLEQMGYSSDQNLCSCEMNKELQKIRDQLESYFYQRKS